jgi:hypothetical protein
MVLNPRWVPTGNDLAGLAVIISVVSAWITTVRARRRMRRALGKKVDDRELDSLNAWMKVEEIEERTPKNPE